MRAVTHWRGRKNTLETRRLLRWIGISLVLHLPVSPLAPWLGLLLLLGAPEQPVPPVDPNEVTAIPVDLVEEPAAVEPTTAPEPPMPAPARELPSEPRPIEQPRVETALLSEDAGRHLAAEERDAGADAAPADADVADAAAEMRDAGTQDTDAGAGAVVRHPVALAGVAGTIADANASVSIAVYTGNIRKHPLGTRVGQLLSRVYQWRDFFGPAGLDPVQDIDRMLIVGPEFNDSSRVVAVLRFRGSESRMRDALNRIVKAQPGGKKLAGKVPVGTATADRAERLIAMPAPHLAVIAPPNARKSVLGLAKAASRKGEVFPGPSGDELVVAHVVAPWAALARARVPVKVPRSIQSATITLVPSSDGGVLARVQAEDESPESAKQHAAELTVAVRAAARVGRGFIRFSAIQKVEFWAEGKTIRGEAHATGEQVALAMTFIGPMLMPADDLLPPVAPAPNAVATARPVSSSGDGAASAAADAGTESGPPAPTGAASAGAAPTGAAPTGAAPTGAASAVSSSVLPSPSPSTAGSVTP